jgi:YfiH family protein
VHGAVFEGMAGAPELSARIRGGVWMLEDHAARAAGVLVAFCDRRGGVSRAPFDSLNLGGRTGDDPSSVAENRRRAARAVGFCDDALKLARQVHGADVVEVTAESPRVAGRADGLVARRPGPVLGILTADCAPVVIAGSRGVTIVHAGWRGLAAGVVERGVSAVAPPAVAWVGPAIGACCYRVGPEVVDAFGAAGLPVDGPDRVDPAAAAVVALRRAGVDRVGAAALCTSCHPNFFSYRRDGVTGRQGAFAALLGE